MTDSATRLPDTDATGMAAMVREGEVSARELVETAIARIEQMNPEFNAVVATRFEEALAEVDAGLPQGPLTGVPVLIKDLNMAVKGLPSTHGSRLFAENMPADDAELVARYKRAGMVVLGMSNSPEFGLSPSTEPALHGPTRNPRNLDRSAGGSSGGSAAAVAAGMVPVAHASDGGGSIRIPASINGLVGLKPSRGRVSSFPVPSTLSAPASVHHAVTTSVRDSAVLLDISASRVLGTVIGIQEPSMSFTEHAATPPRPLRIAVATSLGESAVQTQADIVEVVEQTAKLCESLGHTVVPVPVPHDAAGLQTQTAPLMGVAFAASVQARLAQLGRELADDDLEPFSRILFEHYSALPATQLTAALVACQQAGWQFGRLFAEYDVILTPTLAASPPELGVLDPTNPEAMYTRAGTYAAWTQVFNATGMPAISLPMGTDGLGLPVGVQLGADLGQEGLLLSLAGQLEAAAPWQRLA
ncbi:amidase [Nocardioides daedukensis]|uniref:Amidase n=1 Tax=Nocardioides daedukensis TaxID=634462 RepID=A0A7Y9UW06_9ACTN|nr:amidase family protein [Nocardioides daedukensis]NYG59940.1 amidase [Nocardioides daedukensis]